MCRRERRVKGIGRIIWGVRIVQMDSGKEFTVPESVMGLIVLVGTDRED